MIKRLDTPQTRLDSLRGSSINIGTIQRILAWPLHKDDMHKSRSVKNTLQTRLSIARSCTLHLPAMQFADASRRGCILDSVDP